MLNLCHISSLIGLPQFSDDALRPARRWRGLKHRRQRRVHESCLKRKKICAFVLIVCLFSGLAPTAESVSVKLRGKIALGGILSGLAYVTYALVTHDKRAAEKMQLHLGPPDRVIQFERGFDRWRIDAYRDQCYLFRNNLLIKTGPCGTLQSNFSKRWTFAPPSGGGRCGFKPHLPGDSVGLTSIGDRCGFKPHLPGDSVGLIDTLASGNPKWLPLCLSHPQRVPQFVSSYLYRLEAERLLDLEPWLSR